MDNRLDQIISRMQKAPSFNVHTIDPTTDSTLPDLEVGQEVVHDLVIRESNLAEQIQLISAQIQYWGRLEARSKRVWEIEDRKYRMWRDTIILTHLQPTGEKWKKPTNLEIEARYRALPEYAYWQAQLERAEEAYNSCCAITAGFRAKRDMIKYSVYRSVEDGKPRFSI